MLFTVHLVDLKFQFKKIFPKKNPRHARAFERLINNLKIF